MTEEGLDLFGTFAQELLRVEERIHALLGGGTPDGPQLHEELQIAFEELQVAQEQLSALHAQLLASRELAEGERQRYEELFELSPCAYIVTDLEGVIRQTNRAAAMLLHGERDFLLGKRLAIFIDSAHLAALRGAHETLRADPTPGATARFSARIFSPLEAETEVDVIAVVLHQTVDGQNLGWLLQDVTEHARSEARIQALNETLERRVAERTEELEAALEEARRLSAAKDEFLGHIAHEVRTPLTVMLGNARLLTRHEQFPDEERIRSSLADIAESAEHLEEVIAGLMLLAQVEGQQRLRLEPLPLPPILRRGAAVFRELSPARRIEVVAQDDLPFVLVQQVYVEQLLQNLLSNADKYSPPDRPVEINARRRDGELLVSVRDYGDGIPEGELERIFQPFFRSPAWATRVPGTGIGLTVCQRLVEAQGGRIWAGSWEGGGAEISFTLPLATPPPADDEEPEASPASS